MKIDNKKLLIGILIGIIVTSGVFYAVDQFEKEPSVQEEDQTCKNLPELPDDAIKQ